MTEQRVHHQHKILIVDDDVEFQGLLNSVLAKRHEIYPVRTIADARKLVTKHQFDLAIVDGHLGGQESGEDFIAWLRSSDYHFKVIFISWSWRDLQSFHRLLKKLNVSRVVNKPVRVELLVQQVERVLSSVSDYSDPSIDQKASTEELQLEDLLAELKGQYAPRLMASVNQIRELIEEARNQGSKSELIQQIIFDAHKIAGTSGSFGFVEIGGRLGELERLFGDMREEVVPWSEGWNRVDQIVDDLSVSEIVPYARESTTTVELPIDLYGSAERTILLVANDSNDVEIFKQAAKEQQVEVIRVETMLAAHSACRERVIDALIVEELFSDKSTDGATVGPIDLIRRLRSLEPVAGASVAILGGLFEIQSRIEASQVGVQHFIEKPLTLDAIRDSIERLIRLRTSTLPRIMVVDNHHSYDDMVDVLQYQAGAVVRVVPNINNLLRDLENFSPDLLIIETTLKEISGIDIVRMLRTSRQWERLPIFVVNAEHSREHLTEAFLAGADDYLERPVVREELLARLQSRLERDRLRKFLSERDPLTGLLSRRVLIERIRVRLSEALREKRPFCLCLIDIDHFKKVNDTHGHLVGDRVLAGMGQLLTSRFRGEDVRGRWGGEEFLIGILGDSLPIARTIVERTLAEFSRIPFSSERGDTFYSTFSAGIAMFPDEATTFEQLLSIADSRLYLAKQGGRNRVEVGTEDETQEMLEPLDGEALLALEDNPTSQF